MSTVLGDDVAGLIRERAEEWSARGLAHAVSAAIRDGALTPGTRLPAIRALAGELSVSPTTVSAAWALLRRSGALLTDGRRGTVVASPEGGGLRLRRTVDRAGQFELDLSGGVPDAALLPGLEFALAGLTGTTPSSYLDEPTLPALEHRLRLDWPFAVDALQVVDGAMDAMELITRTVVQFGDRVVVEDPCFPPIIDLLEFLGARIVAVPVDAEGLSAEALERALAAPVAAVVLQPRAHNPTGVSLTPRRERELADVMRVSGALVIEDDSAGAVALSPARSLGRHVPGQVVHIRSFAKSHGPDLRLAALSAPEPMRATLQARRELGQGWSSRLLQRLLLRMLTDPRSVAQVAAARAAYATRRAAFVAALATRGIAVGGEDGINVWIPVTDEPAAVLRLATRGIGVAPGSPFQLGRDAEPHIRITCGLLALGPEALARLADEVADAAALGSWSARR